MPLTADGRLVDQTPLSTQSTDIVQHAPPLYGEHVLDQLYADVDQSGMMTPAPQSGMNTPFYNHSGTGSAENLAVLTSGPHPAGAVPPAALSSRLQNLNLGSRNNSFRRLHRGESEENTPYSQPHNDGEPGYFDHSASHSNPLSRRTSEEERGGVSNMTSGRHSPEHIDFSELGDLTKVPSYQTAVKTPVRGMSYNDALPNYEAAVSAPPSPTRTFSGPITPGTENGESMNGLRRNPLSTMGFTPIHPPPPAHMGDGDERRRLHILQNRGRAH
jgi:hypothetical protein